MGVEWPVGKVLDYGLYAKQWVSQELESDRS